MRLHIGHRLLEKDGKLVIEVGLGETYIRELITLSRSDREAALHHFVRIIEWAERFGETGLSSHVSQLDIKKSAVDFYGWPVWNCTLSTTLTRIEYDRLIDSRIQRLRESGRIRDPRSRQGVLALRAYDRSRPAS